MGISSEPAFAQFGNDCLACFAPNETPLHIYASFTGISATAWWLMGDGEAGNRIYKLTQREGNPCGWDFFGPDYIAKYETGLVRSDISLFSVISEITLFRDTRLPCKHTYENDLVPAPGVPFAGGNAVVVSLPQTAYPSLSEIAELLNVAPAKATYHDHFYLSATELVDRIARKQDATNVKIKYDFT